MFSHIMVGAHDIEASKKFYDAVLGAIGIPPGGRDDRGRVFYVTKTGVFAITKPIVAPFAAVAAAPSMGFVTAKIPVGVT